MVRNEVLYGLIVSVGFIWVVWVLCDFVWVLLVLCDLSLDHLIVLEVYDDHTSEATTATCFCFFSLGRGGLGSGCWQGFQKGSRQMITYFGGWEGGEVG